MKKNSISSILLLIGSLLALSTSTLLGVEGVYAEVVSGNGVTVNYVIPFGGSALGLSGGGVTVHDVKGQPVIGISTGDIPGPDGPITATVIFGWGPMWSLVPIVIEEGVPEGTVPLTIARDGNNILITWNNGLYGDNISLFYLPGDGTGIYTNTPDPWQAVDGNFTLQLAQGRITHNNQVGAGLTEVYYKALQPGYTRTSLNSDNVNVLSTAWSVGKFNVNIEGQAANAGKNLMSIPFISQAGTTVASVFGTGTPWQEGDIINSKNSADPTYLSAIYRNGSWASTVSGNAPDFIFTPEYAFEIVTRANKIFTSVGEVPRDPISIAVWGMSSPPDGKTLLGMAYPRNFQLSDSTLIANGASNGDIIQYKVSALAPAYISAVVVNSQWRDASSGQAILPVEIGTLRPSLGYVYATKGGGFTWQRSPNY